MGLFSGNSTNSNSSIIDYYKQKYKLMEQNGYGINWFEFEQSVEKNWPYPVATEAERKGLEGFDYMALRGHVIDISRLLYEYSYESDYSGNDRDYDYDIYKDPDKVNFWKTYLVEKADSGDWVCQAALLSEMGIFDGVRMGWLSENERALFKDKYEGELYNKADEGYVLARYAIAQFGLFGATYESDFRRILAEQAMNAGIGDAAYLMAEIIRHESKDGDFYPKTLECYVKGAQSNSGSMLGKMQYFVADAYEHGEEWFAKDDELARYYYLKAVENGFEAARNRL